MNSAVAVLKLLIRGDMPLRDLVQRVGIKDRQMANVIADLERAGYVTKRRDIVMMSGTPKAALLRDLAGTMDLGRLLGRSREAVLAKAGEAETTTAEDIARDTGLSRSTVAKSVADLESVGALVKRGSRIAINPSQRPVREFATLLKLERDERYVDGAEIIYNQDSLVIRKVLAGKTARGEPTGFTAFSSHGVEYATTHDYFCECGYELTPTDILLHAVLEASRTRSGSDMLMCMVFYVKHKNAVDVMNVREKAGRMGLRALWLDVEAYVRQGEPKDAKMFYPWAEFKEKLDLYDVPESEYVLPPGHDSMFDELNEALEEPITAYLFGGENMRIKGLKSRTKDFDMAVSTQDDFSAVKNALVRMGYIPQPLDFSDEDERIHPSLLLTHDSKSRIDLFTRTIIRMQLSPRMMEKADMRDYGKLRLGLLCDEHVFVLKAAAGREGDIQDMNKLVRAGQSDMSADGQFDWDEVLQAVRDQSGADPTNDTTANIFACMSAMHDYEGMRIPVLDQIRRLVADLMIKSALRGGSLLIRDVVRHVERFDIAETAIRNRIDAMVRDGHLLKAGARRTARLILPAEAYPAGGRITVYRIRRYLNWRFVLREQPLPGGADAEDLTRGLQESGFQTISQVDSMIGGLVDCLSRYEREQFKERYFNAVGAARVCMGLNDPRLGNALRSDYFVIELHKYGKRAGENVEGSD